ncbi:hypothetical protein Tco_1011764 [Tanacetum coccineum]
MVPSKADDTPRKTPMTPSDVIFNSSIEGQFPGIFSTRVLDLKSNLFKGCKKQGNVLVSPKEVQSKSTRSRSKVQTKHQNELEVNAREQVQERKWQ